MRRTLHIAFALLIFAAFHYEAVPQTKEYLLKAGFLSKFAKFVEWPSEANANDLSKPFIITVLGNNPFADYLDNMYKGRKIRNKSAKIRYITKTEDIGETHILFICADMKDELAKILRITENKPILTIGESEGLAKKGVLINFYLTNRGTVHFEINENKVKLSGLKMDVLLLEIAKIVK